MKCAKRVLIVLLGIMLGFLSGCMLPTNKPLSILSYPSSTIVEEGVEDSRELIVLLRGRRGSNRNFEKYNWIELIHSRFPNADILAPDTHLGYYMARSVSDRLHEDIIGAKTQNGESHYTKVIVIGVSMGSLGALLYESEYPDMVDQYYLIAPYLGYEKVETDINEKGGLSDWGEQNENPKQEERWPYKLWGWIADEHEVFSPRVKIGYGRQDRYSNGQEMFATLISDEDVVITNGEHNYVDFTEMLSKLLELSD